MASSAPSLLTYIQKSNLVKIILVWKCSVVLIVLLNLVLGSGVGEYAFDTFQHWPPGPVPNWQSSLATWDAAHYLHLATEGYTEGSPSCAFYPMWPFVIRICHMMTGADPFWIALLLANGFSIVGVVLFHRICSTVYHEPLADRATILFLCLPGSLFLSLIYSEPLFLALTTGVLYLLLRKRFWLACIFATFLPLTRPVGIFIVVPIFLEMIRDAKKPRLDFCLLCLPLLGYGSYFLTMAIWTGNPLEGFEAQKHFPTQPSISRLWDIPGFVKSFASSTKFHHPEHSMLDRWFFILFLLLIWKTIRKHPAIGLFTLILGVFSVMPTRFISFTRHFVMCFPLIFTLSEQLNGNGSKFKWRMIISAFAGIQVYLWYRYTRFEWSG